MDRPSDPGAAAQPTVPGGERALLLAAARLLLKGVRVVAVWSGWLWLAAMAVLVTAWRWRGETNASLAFSMYLPPAIWLMPLLVLWPVTAVLAFRHAAAMAAMAAVLGAWGFGWEWREAAPMTGRDERGAGELVILSNNRGQHGGHSLRPFKNRAQPDIMVFQESAGTAPGYLADSGYQEFKHGTSLGEFTILSRFPVTKSEAVTDASRPGGLVYAARFEIDWDGRRLVVYNVHLPTPRDTLLSMRMGGFLYGLPVPLARWRERGAHLGGFWRGQEELVEDLMRRVEKESGPVIVAGDLNVPPFGRIHQLLSGRLTDAHPAGGAGFGFTFPGETRNPLSLGGPWMRIDYIFSGGPLEVSGCWSEPERRSQHRAVAAGLRLAEGR